MITITYCEVSYECAVAVKGRDYIELRDASGMPTHRFDGVADFTKFAIVGGQWSDPDGVEELRVLSSTLTAGNLVVTPPDEVGNGTLLKFVASCSCDAITGGLLIGNDVYTIVNAMGDKITGTNGGGNWQAGATVAVILDKTNFKAYLQSTGRGLLFRGVNPITASANDTVTLWQTLGSGIWLINVAGALVGQPCQTGFISSLVNEDGTLSQEFHPIGESLGPAYTRNGNKTGWYGNATTAGTWKKVATAPTVVAVNLPVAGWDALLQQTVNVLGILADETKQLIWPAPALANQYDWENSSIRATGQATDSLTFTAVAKPAGDVLCYVSFMEV